ncbi:hypothetical protein [Actinomadura decatromicini]|uniref:GAF domain-containing protein n=1 Tax=Actinomadura decatromicini TaxID=2604572 RepID=A0A5D3FS99_9ACTN|nr:hypothetical protein [Actinomadura decatromicini]TYK51063.1 hypothetical protein FXF68_11470 [Actinomadura decatromicini]
MNGNGPSATDWGPPSVAHGADNGPRVAASFNLMAAVLDGITLPELLTRVAEQARAIAGVPLTFIALPAGPILILPLDTGDATRGVLAVLGRPGAEPFSPSAARQLLLFADTSARLVQLTEDQRASPRRPKPAGERIVTLHPPLPPRRM